MAYSKCPACGRAIAKVRVVLIDPDPFMFMPDALRPPMRLGLVCAHAGCGADLQRGEAPAIDQTPSGAASEDKLLAAPWWRAALQAVRTFLGCHRS